MGVVVVWDRDDGAWHAVGLLGVVPVLLLMGEACGSCLLGCWCGVWESYSGREHLCMPARAVIVVWILVFAGFRVVVVVLFWAFKAVWGFVCGCVFCFVGVLGRSVDALV